MSDNDEKPVKKPAEKPSPKRRPPPSNLDKDTTNASLGNDRKDKRNKKKKEDKNAISGEYQ